MAEIWHAPKTWPATDYVVTATDMNEQVRDNIAYLKGVLSGSNLQNVAIHANRLLTHGGMRVHRHPYNNHRHIEARAIHVPRDGGTTNVTFANAFASTPNIVLGRETGASPEFIYITAKSATGFTVQNVRNDTDYWGFWIAEGPD